jgi:hypothetical protein
VPGERRAAKQYGNVAATWVRPYRQSGVGHLALIMHDRLATYHTVRHAFIRIIHHKGAEGEGNGESGKQFGNDSDWTGSDKP